MKPITPKSPGQQYTSDDSNNITAELQNAIENTGITLSGGDLFQISKSMSNYVGSGDYFSESGAVDAYVLAPISSKKAPTSYAEGLRVRFQTVNSNTGPSTVNLNSLGVKNIVDSNNAPLSGDEIQSGKIVTLYYDGTSFILVDSSTFLTYKNLTNDIKGLTLSNNTTDPNNDIDIAIGSFEDDFNEQLAFTLNTALTKQLDATWAEGTNAGGLPTTLVPSVANTWYHVFAIANAVGNVDVGFDTSLTPTNLSADPAIIAGGYIYARRIGSILTDGAANILLFQQFGNRILWDTASSIAPALTTSYVSYALPVPPAINVTAQMDMNINTATIAGDGVDIKGTYQTGGGTIVVLAYPGTDGTGYVEMVTDTTQQVDLRRRGATAAGVYAITTIGWIDLTL